MHGLMAALMVKEQFPSNDEHDDDFDDPKQRKGEETAILPGKHSKNPEPLLTFF
jgi:hypothetical protein